ncbi:MAG: CRISPR-associated endoribonuclease Cas6 [Victivallaceae bacterium]
MQIEIKLVPAEKSILGFDYLYQMHSALMTTLTSRNPDLAKDLHEGSHENRMKMFVFSPLNSTPTPKLVQVEGEERKRMLLGEKIWFRIASPWPEFLNSLGESLLVAGQMNIAGKNFKISGVNMIAPPELKEQMVWRPFGQSASICTPWSPPDNGKKLFIYPDKPIDNSPTCSELLANNLYHKFKRLQEIRPDIADAWLKNSGMNELPSENAINVEFLPSSPTQSYKTIMNYGKNAAIRSWRCPVKITAPLPLQRLVWAAGLGSMNAQGYGLMQEGKQCN